MFCKTGSENVVAQSINAIDNTIKVVVPVRVLQEKISGIWEERERLLIPGYVFIYVEDEVSFDLLKMLSSVYKILEYQTGERELIGSDYEYAEWIYRHNGRIGPSRALVEGSTIKVIDGPLIDGIGTVTKLDRHKRRAWVEFDFDGKIQKVSLSVIDIDICSVSE
ncbi:MAG TPA: transcription termination/antitermination NusG family protein [Clostridiales bacterium]|nr:transcription termination/antitermination NusG family protein [Clostridiales bacterium]